MAGQSAEKLAARLFPKREHRKSPETSGGEQDNNQGFSQGKWLKLTPVRVEIQVLHSSSVGLLAEVPSPYDHDPPMHFLREDVQAAAARSVEAEALAFHHQILRANAAGSLP